MTRHRTTRKRPPTWVIVAGVAVASVALVVGGIWAVAAAIGGYGVAQVVGHSSDRAAAEHFDQVDPEGADACRYLDMEMGGIATWEDVAPHAAAASTPAIRAATIERALYDACTAAGAHMSSWPGQLPSYD